MSENETIFKEYLEEEKGFSHLVKKSKFWLVLFCVLAGIILLGVFYKTVIVDTMGAEEVSGAIDVVWQDTGWVTKKVTPYEVTVVPTVTFKIKNTGKRPLEYVNFEGIFRIEETGNELGSGGALAFREPLEPGVVSDDIVLKSNFGYTGRTKELILNNPEWKQIQVKIFARTKGSPAVAIGDPYPVKKVIERSAGGALETPAAEKEASLNAESFEKIGKTLQIVEFDSVWVDRLRSAHKAIIVPSITFYVKNVGNEPMKNVIFKGEFVFEDDGEKLSEGTAVAFKKELPGGETGKAVNIRAELGYEATSKAAFIKNTQNWRRVKVNIFAKQKDYEYVLLGTYSIKQEIEGVKVVYQ